MAKKNNSFGKFLAFTTAVAAIGGTCYIFRDKIKACPFYQKSADKLSEIKDCLSDKFCNQDDDDFYFDDEDDDFEDVFSDAEQGREYTSITINPKDEAESASEVDDNGDSDTVSKTDTEEVPSETDSQQEEPAISNKSEPTSEKFENTHDETTTATEDSIPTITFGSSLQSDDLATEDSSKQNAATAEVTGYENEGLSDVSEDSDVLEEQDRLDF
jgi:hypothetical protein